MLQGLLVAEGARSVAVSQDADAADGNRALYRRPRTTKPEPGHKIYPYLLRGMASRGRTRCGDGHHLHPMARGFVYLAVVLDWFSRRVCRGAYRSRWNGILRRDA